MDLFKYDDYQSVRWNLFLYSIPVLNVGGFLAFEFILPTASQQWVGSVINHLSAHPLLKAGSGAAVFSLVAYLMVEIFKIHDRIYDKYIVRWRERYDLDYIIPRLLRPFLHRVRDGDRFFTEAARNLKDFMETLYYPYVGDRDTKIRQNLLVRFYEQVTPYWLTQVNEIVLILLTLLVAGCHVLGPPDPRYQAQLLPALLVIVGAFALNRLAVRATERGVREATEAEIEDILANHQTDLEAKLRGLTTKYGIPFA